MKVRTVLFSLFFALVSFQAAGQFYTAGQDPGALKWKQMTTANYRVIYPSGLDSLAGVFARNLEAVRTPVSASIGFLPNQYYRQPMRVVLHPYTADANGSVGATPFQMELYTVPDAYNPLPLQWETDLVTHESRHAAQMQFGRHRGYMVGNYIIGDLFSGAIAALYGSNAFFEGDAVVAETALSRSGRGRSADFLEYMRMAFDNGDTRNWYSWRYGSQGLYTPDYYKIGYMTIAGARAAFDDPLFTERFYENVFRHKFWHFPLFNLPYTLKQDTGLPFRQSFEVISDYFQKQWEENTAMRAPLDTAFRQVTENGRGHTEFRKTVSAGNGTLYSVRNSIYDAPRLMAIGPDGTARTLARFSSVSSKLDFCEKNGRILWSEPVPDLRWSLKQSSRIRFYDTGRHRTVTLTGDDRYYNPAFGNGGEVISATRYPINGGSSIDILDADDGKLLARFDAPDSLKFTESVWTGDGRLVATGISRCGCGLYEVGKDGITCLIAPEPHSMKQLRARGREVFFANDSDGVNEIYSFDVLSGTVSRITNTRYGASEADIDGRTIYFGTLSPAGRSIYSACVDSLHKVPADPGFEGAYPIADKLCLQEAALTGLPRTDTVVNGAVKRYSKPGNLFRIHAWAPLYVDYDSIKSLSLESVSSAAGLGATVFFQNDLGTMTGSAGISFGGIGGLHKPSGIFKFSYNGLYPVFEGRLEINTSQQARYWLQAESSPTGYLFKSYGRQTERIGVAGGLKAYVPLNFSKGGWSRGIIPQINYQISNDFFNSSIVGIGYLPSLFDKKSPYMAFIIPGQTVYLQRLTASLRAYSTLATAPSCIYPKLGIGGEIGYCFRPGLKEIMNPSAFALAYGYLPGIAPSHGIRLQALGQWNSGAIFPDPYTSAVPRGLKTSAEAYSFINKNYPFQCSFSLDYAMPVLALNWDGLGPVAYVRNFELIPHADLAFFGTSPTLQDNFLFSAGASLSVRLGNILWVPFGTRIGVDYSFNTGSIMQVLGEQLTPAKRHSLSLLMSVDF